MHDRLVALGARLVVQALADPATWVATPQPDQGVTYAHKIDKSEAAIDWCLGAAQIARRVRAFDPFPGATARVAGETLKVWSAEALADEVPALEAPGTVLRADAQGIVVQTGDGALCLNTLQRPGAKRLSAADFLRGFALLPGMAFELPDTNQSAD